MIDIKLENMSKKYGDKIIFNNYNLEINNGEIVCITGESGRGKSTLLNIIGMLDKPDSGTLTIKNIENPFFNNSKGRKLLKNDISYIFQNYGLVDNQTALYNLQISTYF